MTDRPDAPPRTWQSILDEVPEATPVGGLTAAPEPQASTVATYARRVKRDDETPADILAAIEYEVADTPTREALDTMRTWRDAQRKEIERLDELEPPDDRGPFRRRWEGFLTALPGFVVGFALFPTVPDESFDSLALLGAVAAIAVALRTAVIEAGWSRNPPEWRGMLLVIGFVTLAGPIIGTLRLALAGGTVSHGTVTSMSLVAQVVAALLVFALALHAPPARVRAERRREQRRTDDPNRREDSRGDFYDDVEDQTDAITAMVERHAPHHLRAALTGRDLTAARSSRHTVVDAIRVLLDRGQVSDDEALWMLREALTR